MYRSVLQEFFFESERLDIYQHLLNATAMIGSLERLGTA